MCCSCLHHLLPWVASCSLFMHHACLCVMPCSCVVCLLCCVLLLDCSCFVAIVRMRLSTCGSSSWLHLLHGLVLLPCGISGKMTISLDLTTIIAVLVASFYRFAALPIACSSSLPLLPCRRHVGTRYLGAPHHPCMTRPRHFSFCTSISIELPETGTLPWHRFVIIAVAPLFLSTMVTNAS